ncbi:hypothetical protein H6P81_011133 [Aristolochia fimbriata]|uniref:Anthocyanin 5-aromatic acyltransferase n=1 Tax=Aristolochia fimbriata TaxID=158543 RepID=A0AAV7EQZ9_ARIFI|nr:hypothetical protein H6P81_011133 [Aristolochia fimbriata]
MASVKVVERVRVSPPPGSVPTSDLTLTYFDDVWLLTGPIQRLLFYRYDGTTTHDFRDSYFSDFRRSLSLALAIFYPIAGRLIPLHDDNVIRYTDGDSVPVTLAESRADFDHLVGNYLKDADDLHPFAPPLSSPEDGERKPLLAVQATVFPFAGICVGVTLHHAVADGTAATSFLRTWASISKAGGVVDVETWTRNPPLYDRALVGGGLEELKRRWVEDIRKIIQLGVGSDEMDPKRQGRDRVLRGTFVLTRAHVDDLRRRLTSSRYDVGLRPSTYTIATAYVWFCWTRSRDAANSGPVHFGFAVDCRSRLSPPVPAAYFGNCVGVAFAEASGSELSRENGFPVAAEAIHKTIRGLGIGGDNMKEVVYWIPNWIRLPNKRIISVASSPRFRVYEADFGWGRPDKVDLVSIEQTGAMSLAERRDEEGGVEIGFVGPDVEMERFASVFEDGLKNISC